MAPEMPSSGVATHRRRQPPGRGGMDDALRLRERVGAGLGRRRADHRRGGGGDAGIGWIEGGEPGRRHDEIERRISLRAREQARCPTPAPSRPAGRSGAAIGSAGDCPEAGGPCNRREGSIRARSATGRSR